MSVTWEEFLLVARGWNGLIEGDDPEDEVFTLLRKKGLMDEDGFWIAE